MNYYRHVAFSAAEEYGLEIIEGASLDHHVEVLDDSTGEVVEVFPGAVIRSSKKIYLEGHIENGYDTMRVLHEIGHHVCKHTFGPTEAIVIISQEREAWEFAFCLASNYDLILYNDDVPKCVAALCSHFSAQGYSVQDAHDRTTEVFRELFRKNPKVRWLQI